MGYAQNLIDEITYEEKYLKEEERHLKEKQIEYEVGEELSLAIQEELAGKHGAQALIDSV